MSDLLILFMSLMLSGSVSFCCITNHPQMRQLKIKTIYSARDSVHHQFRLGSVGSFLWSWLSSLMHMWSVKDWLVWDGTSLLHIVPHLPADYSGFIP